jgi:hypothetical protein
MSGPSTPSFAASSRDRSGGRASGGICGELGLAMAKGSFVSDRPTSPKRKPPEGSTVRAPHGGGSSTEEEKHVGPEWQIRNPSSAGARFEICCVSLQQQQQQTSGR